ncbi:MAG: GHMP kinase [Flavobacteriaceae bacterium]|nr:GHMP kinase [Flavobacteriaceae bacterium]|tara:strand:- start:34556 stop:35482 length:927 start_codon:yes stop_codon:yes gene_type:complete
MHYYSNGKLLLTAEYLVLEGATALALPTKFGQDLQVTPISNNEIVWSSFDHLNQCWFEAVYSLPKLQIKSATFISGVEGNQEMIAEVLQIILYEAQKMNPDFLVTEGGFRVKTHLSFPRNWGLGSSSTLINNVASWAEVDAYKLLKNAFKGSGYDIACAQNDFPIFYRLEEGLPIVSKSSFRPKFANKIFFVYLNKKQNSRESINLFYDKRGNLKDEIKAINKITKAISKTSKFKKFERLINEHEDLISGILELPKVKDQYFSDFPGTVKSLGGWGGDFVMVTGDEDTPSYFKNRGYKTVLSYDEMIL